MLNKNFFLQVFVEQINEFERNKNCNDKENKLNYSVGVYWLNFHHIYLLLFNQEIKNERREKDFQVICDYVENQPAIS